MKNMQKYRAYKLAHNQIKRAIEAVPPFPIEAIALEESILADRLQSALEARIPEMPDNPKRTFGKILGRIRDQKTRRAVPAFADLDEALEKKGGVRALAEWYTARNRFVHSMARSPRAGEPTAIESETFFEEGQAVAKEGAALVRLVSNWSQKCIRANG